jgi:regulator of protease activity HflC (stomatin/prohibitin superfamily)
MAEAQAKAIADAEAEAKAATEKAQQEADARAAQAKEEAKGVVTTPVDVPGNVGDSNAVLVDSNVGSSGEVPWVMVDSDSDAPSTSATRVGNAADGLDSDDDDEWGWPE